MIIRSIDINNFLSYYKKNTFYFDVGPTIIIGQNNTGKSKLFDAFNWALYNRAFKTNDEKWFDTKEWKDDIINNLAKNDCKAGDSVTCSVSISFEDENENRYLLTRDYLVKKTGNNSWDCGKSTDLSLSKTDNRTQNISDYFDKEAEEELRILFPENLSKYYLFQGENISQIMSLSNKSAFTNALRDLSRIEVFERAKAYTEKVLKTMKREFENKEDQDTALQQKRVALSMEVERMKDESKYLEEQFDNECKERDLRKELFDKKNEELKKYKECLEIIREIEHLETQRNSKNELRNDLLESQKRDIFEKWMYAGTESILKKFIAFYNKNKIEKKIPEPIRQEFIREMLEAEMCKVCDSHAPKGSPQFERIETFLNDKSLDKEIEVINQLSWVADSTLDKVERIAEEIQSFYTRSHEIEEQIKTIQNRIKSKEDELRNVIPADVSEDDLKTKNFGQIQRDREAYKADLEKSEHKINQIKGKREHLAKTLEDKIKEYDSLIESASNTKEKEKYLLAEKINDSTFTFYDHFLNRIITEIETCSNNFFTKMTMKNSALSGKVKVDYTNKEVYPISDSGERLYNINQANKVSLQISFVAAVLNVSNNFWDTYFPFIADAPISALGGNNKITAVDTMIDIFNQSIIILKDDAVTMDPESIKKDLIRNLIKNSTNIKNAYELVMEGSSVKEQHTVIKKIK